jgi:hypothetical protein
MKCFICELYAAVVKMNYGGEVGEKLLCRCCQWKEKRRLFFEKHPLK